MNHSPTSPVLASSSTLWATASKDWVVPAKPKPGRKPKKDAIPLPKEEAELLDSKGRRVQNRAAQRAFRERKQSQLAELQARLQQYEQGEIERNVALQNIAKRLKEENEKLRQENVLLKEKMAKVDQGCELRYDPDRKRCRMEGVDGLSVTTGQPLEYPYKKKTKFTAESMGIAGYPTPLTGSYLPSPSSASSPDSNCSSMSMQSPPRELPGFSSRLPNGSNSNIFDLPSNTNSTAVFDANSSFGFDCGFCNDETPCVCRELALHQVSEKIPVPPEQTSLKTENVESKAPALAHDEPMPLSSSSPNTISILDDLPSYQPPVPLRRRPENSMADFQRASSSTCSGDPSNCLACSDDAFGKAFCIAVGESIASKLPCSVCPDASDMTAAAALSTSQTEPDSLCCGDPNHCSPVGCEKLSSSMGVDSTLMEAPLSSHDPHRAPETIPTDDAWRQLKSHPNVAFSDLSLLAEVVARRSKCAGPRVVISPAPGTITPERGATDRLNSTDASERDVLLTDPHAQYRERRRERTSSPPRLVPQDVLISCGRARVREVYADGVREALRLLDAKFPRS